MNNLTLLIMRGLPASGKSTVAKELLKSKQWKRVNRDLLREMLHNNAFSGQNERVTIEVEKAIVTALLKDGFNVVVDDCNISEHHAQMWLAIAVANGAKFKQNHIATTWQECIERDKGRDNSVGAHVIKQMALQYNLLLDKDISRGIVVCDIDGTIANIDHRLHHVQKEPKDWKSFFSEMDKDTVREDVKAQIKQCEEDGYDIIFVSARPEDYREVTERWLIDNVGYNFVLMRKGGDKRPDTIVKQEIYDKYLKHHNVVRVYDDRPSVIRMWEENGLQVIDCGQGIEF